MKRAIYVGKPEEYPYQYPVRHPLHYGMTGEVHDNDWMRNLGLCGFYPDGNDHPENAGSFVDREDVYIPSEDATRHCPNPEWPVKSAIIGAALVNLAVHGEARMGGRVVKKVPMRMNYGVGAVEQFKNQGKAPNKSGITPSNPGHWKSIKS